ncbi:MAG: PTS fructose transporter subunit IIC, partial [Propionibacteriaceae bacterium]|nr:PTS fructose transporter subunit IIC [Propionibacteriaceae bacterium]
MSGNIVAVTGCVIGMAHSRMAAEALRKAAAAEGIQFAVEIHGFAGVEGKLSAEQ